MTAASQVSLVGRYVLASEIASGGMASVYLGRLTGAAGFARVVAIKRLHPHLAKEPSFVAMFVDEARMAARIHHANVVPTLDVVTTGTELCLVMEYVHGASLASLLEHARNREQALPIDVAVAVASGALHGLHAAHEAKNDRGEALHIVHRDVSPQNILVGADGIARVFDFGIAKASGRLQTTNDGSIKGKCAYMAPEQLNGEAVDRRADIFAAGVVLWEALVNQRLFTGETPAAVLAKAMTSDIAAPRALRPEIPLALEAVVLRALARDPDARWSSASEMAVALEACGGASAARVAEWVNVVAHDVLKARKAALAAMEGATPLPGSLGSAEDVGASPSTRTMSAIDISQPEASPPSTAIDVVDAAARPRSRAPWLGAAALLVLGAAAFLRRSPSGAPGSGAVEKPPAPVSASAEAIPAATAASSSSSSPAPIASPAAPSAPALRPAAPIPRRTKAPPAGPSPRAASSSIKDDAYDLSH